jgi:tetratricopeptide (TPR) repeat protein
MIFRLKIGLVALAIVLSLTGKSQPPPKAVIDKMIAEAEAQKSDTAKIRLLLEVDDMIYQFDPQLDLTLNRKAMALAEKGLKEAGENPKLNSWYKETLMDIYSNIGNAHSTLGELNQCSQFHEKSLVLARELRMPRKIARSLNNLGNAALGLDQLEKAEKYFTEALQYYQKDGDPSRKTFIYSNLGLLSKKKGDLVKALEYYYLACEFAEKCNQPKEIGNNYLTISDIYDDLRDTTKVRQYLDLAMEIANTYNFPDLLSQILVSKAGFVNNQGNYPEAEKLILKAIDYYQSIEDYRMLRRLYTNLASMTGSDNLTKTRQWVHLAMEAKEKYKDEGIGSTDESHLYFHLAALALQEGNLMDAEKHIKLAFDIAQQGKEKESQLQTAKLYRKILYELGRYKESDDMADFIFAIKEELLNDETKRNIMQLEAKMQYQVKAEKDSLVNLQKDATIARQEAEAQQNKTQRIALLGGLGLIALFSLFMLNRYRLIARQKKLISQQKDEVEAKRREADHQRELVQEKNKEIIDSINYARHIQQAILPSRDSLNHYLKDGFLLYKPKDIVAGDFYWLEVYNDTVFLAVADCTGHGVPGAMVSVICSNALTKAVQEEHITDPGKILDRTRELVIQRLSKSGEEVKDGMDISLVALPVPTVGANCHSPHTVGWERITHCGFSIPIAQFGPAPS